jgi:hypothetical protein
MVLWARGGRGAVMRMVLRVQGWGQSAHAPQPQGLDAEALGARGGHIALAVEERLARGTLHDRAQLEWVQDLVAIAKLADKATRFADLGTCANSTGQRSLRPSPHPTPHGGGGGGRTSQV